jgi:hypothetical protein
MDFIARGIQRAPVEERQCSPGLALFDCASAASFNHGDGYVKCHESKTPRHKPPTKVVEVGALSNLHSVSLQRRGAIATNRPIQRVSILKVIRPRHA